MTHRDLLVPHRDLLVPRHLALEPALGPLERRCHVQDEIVKDGRAGGRS